MAKSMRSKREKRLRTLRREIVKPFYENKDVAKLAAQEAALAAPKLPVRPINSNNNTTMEITTTTTTTTISTNTSMDVEIPDGGASASLKPVGGIGKKWKKKLKMGKGKRHGKGKKIRRKHNI